MSAAGFALLAVAVLIGYEALRHFGVLGSMATASAASSGGTATAAGSGGGSVATRNYTGLPLQDAAVYPQGTILSQAQLTQMAQSVGFSGQGLANVLAVIQGESGGDPNAVYSGPENSDATGILQFISSTAYNLGLTNRLDPLASLQAAYKATQGGRVWCPSPWGPHFGCGYS